MRFKCILLFVLLFLLISLTGCANKVKLEQELELPVLDTLSDSMCNYTIDKDTVVFGAVMYEISVFKFIGTNVLKTEQDE